MANCPGMKMLPIFKAHMGTSKRPGRTLRYEYTTHNIVRHIPGGKAYFSFLEELINSATHTIHLQVYIFTYDETGARIVDAMTKALGRGVQVYLLVDGYASQHLPGSFEKEMADRGIHFRMFEPLFKSSDFYFGRRLHHKITVVDHVKALIAGINIDNKYNDMPEKPGWLDMGVYTEGEAALQLADICCEMWNAGLNKTTRAHAPSYAQYESLLAPYKDNHCEVRVRRNDWVRRRQQIRHSYIQMLNHAQDEMIIMSSYFLPGKTFRGRMEAAVKRNVKLKVVLAGPSDVMLAKHAERFLYDWLLQNNVEVYEHRNIVHAKVAVADMQVVTIGSFNFNDISTYASIELNLDIKDKTFVSGIHKELNRIIEQECVQITREDYTHTNSFWKRLRQRIAYNLVKWMLTLVTFYYRQR